MVVGEPELGGVSVLDLKNLPAWAVGELGPGGTLGSGMWGVLSLGPRA